MMLSDGFSKVGLGLEEVMHRIEKEGIDWLTGVAGFEKS